MPSAWPTVPLGDVLSQYREYIESPGPGAYPKLSVKLYGKGVVLDAPADGVTLKMKRHQLAKAGQVVLSEIWGKKGAIGLVPSEGDGALCTGHFFLIDVDRGKVEPGWLRLLFAANYLQDQLSERAKGTTGYAAVRPGTLLAATFPLPPVSEQRRIVGRIEELAAKIEEARGLRISVGEDLDSLLFNAYRALVEGASRMPLNEVAPLIRRAVPVDPSRSYPELGVRSFGKGTFHKPSLEGILVGSKRLFAIEPGDLLFNNVFAWEGAVAVAKPDDRGRFGSHRFISCVPAPDLATPEFLCFHLLTPEGLDALGIASPGGAGRNRTLGLHALQGIEVPVPPIDAQKWFTGLLHKAEGLRRLQGQAQAELEALLPSVLERAFRGEL